MMTDFLTWSPIRLGRWGGTQVRIHGFLIVFVVMRLFYAALEPEHAVVREATCLVLLFLALLLHELGHASMAAWLGTEHEEVRLWPLGDLAGPSHLTNSRPADSMLIALAGPAINGAIVVVCSVVLFQGYHAQFIWNPFGHDGSGAPLLLDGHVAGTPFLAAVPYSTAWVVGWFGFINYVIMLANVLPALPFDGGRFFRSYLAHASNASIKDSLFPALFARSCAIILGIVGILRLFPPGHGEGMILLFLAFLIEWIVRSEARMLEDGGFFDDGVFGYDFSEGYTSLESSTAKVRPYRESAIKRWRRRRSELRRQRRHAREAAEERRMDEILEKIHREGRFSLSDEEHRFLIRVSAKYRNRPRAGD